MRSLKTSILALAIAASFAATAVYAAPNPPAAGYPQNQDIGAVISNAAVAPGTVLGVPTTPNNSWSGVVCATQFTTETGSPTALTSIEGFDAATASWYQIAVAGSQTTGDAQGTTKTLAVHPGIATSSLSANNAAQNAVLPKLWRLKQVIGGSGTLTSKTGCNYIN